MHNLCSIAFSGSVWSGTSLQSGHQKASYDHHPNWQVSWSLRFNGKRRHCMSILLAMSASWTSTWYPSSFFRCVNPREIDLSKTDDALTERVM